MRSGRDRLELFLACSPARNKNSSRSYIRAASERATCFPLFAANCDAFREIPPLSLSLSSSPPSPVIHASPPLLWRHSRFPHALTRTSERARRFADRSRERPLPSSRYLAWPRFSAQRADAPPNAVAGPLLEDSNERSDGDCWNGDRRGGGPLGMLDAV